MDNRFLSSFQTGNHEIFLTKPFRCACSSSTTQPTLSQFSEPQNQEIGLLYVVLERRATDFEAPKL